MPETNVNATVTLMEAGRRHAVHRVVTIDGVRQVGTERCNIDDADQRRDLPEGAPTRGKRCRWCFPKG